MLSLLLLDFAIILTLFAKVVTQYYINKRLITKVEELEERIKNIEAKGRY